LLRSEEIHDRYTAVQERIGSAAFRAGRNPEDITLVTVSKTWPAEIVVAAYGAGIRQFGENRAEELASKRADVQEWLGEDCGNIWHSIGALQSRKTKLVADNADVFHALDRLKIAQRLSRRLVESGRSIERPLPVFLEVNVSGEMSKAGFDCRRWEDDLNQREMLRSAAEAIAALPGLLPQGVMTMAPWQVDDKVIRTVFSRTCQLSEWLQTAVPQADWSQLSMGMTDDFEMAIEEGATHVRVGRAILGERN
jgi:pyridoxal phosphate enzyme (YggS family)